MVNTITKVYKSWIATMSNDKDNNLKYYKTSRENKKKSMILDKNT